jgi:hypothetical protein
MLKPIDLCQAKAGLADNDQELNALLSSEYDHRTQSRKIGDGKFAIYPTSTRFDQDRT